MGRGVESIGPNVLYFDASDNIYQNDEWAWDDLIENLRESLSKAFPSLVPYEGWAEYPYRETRGILENYHIRIYISEYMGCGAISVITDHAEIPYLANGWLHKVWKNMVKIINKHVELFIKIGTFSNGIPIFEKRNT